MIRILSVDDDEYILKANLIYFKSRGYAIETARNAEQARSLLASQVFDCVLMDIRLKDSEDGYILCREIKKNTSTAVIFVTSLTLEEQLLEGFDCGGDDYVTKPYSLKVLEARIQARVKEQRGAASKTLCFSSLSIHLATRQVTVDERAIPLTMTEFDILEMLAQHPGTAFTQSEIYRQVWGMSDLGNPSTVQVHVVGLRKKLNVLFPDKTFIRTLWGKGYMFVDE